MIKTIYGERDEALFELRRGQDESDTCTVCWTEYWDKEILVHRSAHIQLKEGLTILPIQGDCNG